MPSLRKRVSTYFRQLSFHNEPRQKRNNINNNAFVTKYLQGLITVKEGPPIIYGKNPTDLPNYELGEYSTGYSSIIGCYSGPNGGLTTVKRTEKHLSVLDADIDFIDTQDEIVQPPPPPKKSPVRVTGQPVDNATMVIKVAGQEYCVTNKAKRRRSKSHSLGSLSDFGIEIEKTKIDRDFYNNNNDTIKCLNLVAEGATRTESEFNRDNRNCKISCIDKGNAKKVAREMPRDRTREMAKDKTREMAKDKTREMAKDRTRGPMKNHTQNVRNPNQNVESKRRMSENVESKRRTSESVEKRGQNYALAKSKSEGNPFQHRKKGKITKITYRSNTRDDNVVQGEGIPTVIIDDSGLPDEWNKKSDLIYGLSDSLYDKNLITKSNNGDPIADCFGVIARKDSAILAVADGVNWGEKASIAAKSAVHGCLHYLNKTIFNDTKPFENLTIHPDETTGPSIESSILITNTREVFVCLLRAFNCAHDLILENNGMLTTLTVAVVLPLKRPTEPNRPANDYVCCVCNVGDTLAYVYSQKYGIRELTKGSHDINCNRDMRDALGALGPVDGINPELSNLTLSITTLQKGDIVLVASDGLTDNFDPNVCKFSVNAAAPAPTNKNKSSTTTRPPAKPPRKSQMRKEDSSSSNRSSSERDNQANLASSSNTPFSSNETKHTDTPIENSGAKSGSQRGSLERECEQYYKNPLVAQFMRENSVEAAPPRPKSSSLEAKKPHVVDTRSSNLRKQLSSHKQEPASHRGGPIEPSVGYKFLRSKTSLDMHSPAKRHVPRNEDGIPYVTPIQRYELQLLLMEDILKKGISGNEPPCTVSKSLCENLVNFTFSITSAKRRTLEDQELYYDCRDGVLRELSQQEKKLRRKKGLERVQNLPGKLDHVSVVAYNVGNFAY